MFYPTAGACRLHVPRTRAGRRRGKGAGCGVKIFAVCQEGTKLPTYGAQNTVLGRGCRGDDCQAKTECGYKLYPVRCRSFPPHAGDGVQPRESGCIAFGGSNAHEQKAQADCSSVPTRSAVSNQIYLDSRMLIARCPGGYRAISCTCNSPWGIHFCGGVASFEPEGSTYCRRQVPRSVSHRRRLRGKGAGAKIFAICIK